MILSQVGGLSLTWSGETTDCHKFPMKEVFEKQLDEKVTSSPDTSSECLSSSNTAEKSPVVKMPSSQLHDNASTVTGALLSSTSSLIF